MKKGLLVTLIICFILFLSGAILLVIGLSTGGKIFFTIDYKNRKVNTSGSRELVNGEQALGEFDSIDIDVSAAEVTVVEGSEYKVRYALYEGSEPTISIDDKKFSMKNEIFDGTLSYGLWGDNSDDEKRPFVEITVPAGTKFENVSISTNAGDIKLDGYEIATLIVDSNAGSLELKNLSVGNVDVDVDCGHVDIADTKAAEVSINAAAGNADISGLTADNVDIDMNCGGLNISSSELGELEAKMNMGKADISETKIDNIDIEADAGDVKLSLIGEEADYYFDLDSNAGNVTIDGSKESNNYTANSGKDKTIKVNTNAGNISIDF